MLEGTAEACGGRILQLQAPVAQLAARRSHNPKVASSILAGSNIFFFCSVFCASNELRPCILIVGIDFGWMAERSKALV